MGTFWAFLIYTVVCFVVSYILVEFGQNFFYDEVTPLPALKVGLGAAIMGGVLTWTHSSFDTMFTSELPKTALLAIVWAGIFILLYRFQPLHGAGVGLVVALILPGLATMAVDGLTRKGPPTQDRYVAPTKILRRGSGGSGAAPVPATPPAR